MIYGDLLEQFADQLGMFFKRIESLQTIVLQHLDKLDVTKYTADDTHINFIVLEMGNLCQIVFSLDADIAFEMWTKYLRIISEHRSLKHISNINSVSTYLASKNVEVLQSVKQNLPKSSDEDEELSAKCFFYLNALTDLMNLINGSFKEDPSQFRTFLLNLFDCLISCYSPFSAEKTGMNIIKSSLVKNTYALLSHLFTDEEFLNSVLLMPADKEFHASVLLLKLSSLQFMKSSSLQCKESFLKNIFSDFLSNNMEDDMKIIYCAVPRCSVIETNSEELVTLYQLAYESITELLKFMPDTVIRDLENAVLNFLVLSSDVMYLLISDVWMYRLRCSSIEFLKDCCYAVLQNLHLENINNKKIENFAKRMLRFLPYSYKAALLERFSSLKFVQESKNVQHRFSLPDLTSTEAEIEINCEEQIQILMGQLNESSNDALKLVKKACTCLELCSLFVNAAGCSEILQFLQFASELFKTDVYEIQIATLSFIKSLSRKSLPEHTHEFGEIVTSLAQLFSKAIHSNNYIVKYEARNVFSYFAKHTPHIKIVQETVKRDSTIKPAMKSYMNAVPENNYLSEKEKMEYLRNQALISNNEKFDLPSNVVDSLQKIFSNANYRCLI